MVKLYDIPRNTIVDVSHLELTIEKTGEKIEKCKFLNLDTPAARMEYKENLFLLWASTEVKIDPNQTQEL